MSPRAASRLESLGFAQVYDYVAGKADWGASGLPLEGTLGPRAGELANTDVPTAHLDERLQDIRTRVNATDWDTCIVVNEQHVVLGRLGRRALGSDDDLSVEEAMSSGPSTVRPSITGVALSERLRHQQLQTALVTTSDGRLVGIITADGLAGNQQELGPA